MGFFDGIIPDELAGKPAVADAVREAGDSPADESSATKRGALTGATIGTTVLGPIGGTIGGAIGGAIGGVVGAAFPKTNPGMGDDRRAELDTLLRDNFFFRGNEIDKRSIGSIANSVNAAIQSGEIDASEYWILAQKMAFQYITNDRGKTYPEAYQRWYGQISGPIPDVITPEILDYARENFPALARELEPKTSMESVVKSKIPTTGLVLISLAFLGVMIARQ